MLNIGDTAPEISSHELNVPAIYVRVALNGAPRQVTQTAPMGYESASRQTQKDSERLARLPCSSAQLVQVRLWAAPYRLPEALSVVLFNGAIPPNGFMVQINLQSSLPIFCALNDNGPAVPSSFCRRRAQRFSPTAQ